MLTINVCTINYVTDPVPGTSNVAMIKIRASPSDMHSLWKIEVSPLKALLVHLALRMRDSVVLLGNKEPPPDTDRDDMFVSKFGPQS